MPFFSSCIRAITSSICARQERKRKRRMRMKTPWILFSWTRLSQPGSLGNRWNEVNRDRRVPVRFSLVSEAVSHESTVLQDLSFKTCKQWIIMTQSWHCLCGCKERGKKGPFSNYKNSCGQKTHTLTHTHATETKMGAVSGVRQHNTWQPCFQEHTEGSRAEHSRYVSCTSNNRRFSNSPISVEHFTTNSLQKVGFPHLDSSSH